MYATLFWKWIKKIIEFWYFHWNEENNAEYVEKADP